LETKQYSLGEGGDVGTGKGGDTGGFNKDFGSTTSGTAWNDAVSVEQSYLPTIEADVNAGNDAAATTTLWDNTSSMFVGAAASNTSDLGEGLGDLALGSAATIAAVGGAVSAAGAFASGNIGGGIVAASGAIGAAHAAYSEFTAPAAQDALNDILNSLNQFLDNYDPTWDSMWSYAVGAGVPGAAKVYDYLQSDGIHPTFVPTHPAMYSAANSMTDTLFPAHIV